MKYFQPLTIPNDWFDKDQVISSIGEFNKDNLHLWKRWNERPAIFNGTLNTWLDQVNCHVFFAELFYTPPGKNLIWHIDTEAPSNFIKINFVWGTDRHYMQWGELIHNQPIPVELTMAGTKYLRFNESEIKVVESTTITVPTIVNIGVPHRVVNPSDNARWCLSVNIHNQFGNRLTMDEAIKTFSGYVQD